MLSLLGQQALSRTMGSGQWHECWLIPGTNVSSEAQRVVAERGYVWSQGHGETELRAQFCGDLETAIK